MTNPKTNVTRAFWEAPAATDAQPLPREATFTEAELEGIFKVSPQDDAEDEFNRDAYDQIRWKESRR